MSPWKTVSIVLLVVIGWGLLAGRGTYLLFYINDFFFSEVALRCTTRSSQPPYPLVWCFFFSIITSLSFQKRLKESKWAIMHFKKKNGFRLTCYSEGECCLSCGIVFSLAIGECTVWREWGGIAWWRRFDFISKLGGDFSSNWHFLTIKVFLKASPMRTSVKLRSVDRDAVSPLIFDFVT